MAVSKVRTISSAFFSPPKFKPLPQSQILPDLTAIAIPTNLGESGQHAVGNQKRLHNTLTRNQMILDTCVGGGPSPSSHRLEEAKPIFTWTDGESDSRELLNSITFLSPKARTHARTHAQSSAQSNTLSRNGPCLILWQIYPRKQKRDTVDVANMLYRNTLEKKFLGRIGHILAMRQL